MKEWTKEETITATSMKKAGKSYVDITNALPNKTYNQVRYFFESKYRPLRQQQYVSKKNNTQHKIIETMDEIKDFLVRKNDQYGDSVFQPVRVFSKADKTEQIKVRIDDKLSRLKKGNDSIESDEDVVSDLIGYLVLLLISMRE
ncbi:MAG: hypothetical protein GOVbin1753_113 [Prokaryotic dsDNA virus sp.]|nr:MAG: hypothetical protein GOVbin1753_113 [Prokaryotic dsDNA virus sp.]|tara:strand:+ start:978 stop:1409 length:432 start_codon:yes stop_codon:yes gene_type:complete